VDEVQVASREDPLAVEIAQTLERKSLLKLRLLSHSQNEVIPACNHAALSIARSPLKFYKEIPYRAA
jgi:hypothetical protein